MKIENFDFENDIREHVLDNLPCEPEFRASLEAEDTRSLLIIYANWAERIISAVPRIIYEAEALTSNPLSFDPRYKPGLDAIRQKIVQGDDLTGHLSKRITKGYRPSHTDQMNLSRRPDLDLMLSDWGVHHLHISQNIESDGFVERTGPLLLAIFKHDNAYLIDIIDHGKWTKRSILKIIVREWPDAGIVYEMKGAFGLSHSYDDDEHKQLRNAAINVLHEIDGKVWMRPGGITTAGSSALATRRSNHLWDCLEQFQERLKSEPLWLQETIASNKLSVPDCAALKFIFVEDGYGVLEMRTGAFYRLSS